MFKNCTSGAEGDVLISVGVHYHILFDHRYKAAQAKRISKAINPFHNYNFFAIVR